MEKTQGLESEKGGGSGVGPSGVCVGSPPGRLGIHRQSIHKQFSTQSGGYPTFTPPQHKGITIKSPQGDSLYFTTLNHNHRHSHSHAHAQEMPNYGHQGGRRHSARSPYDYPTSFQVGRKSQSQETVNLSLLISNARGSPLVESRGNGEENISLRVPTPEEREAKRANFASGCTWECNVSGDSSVSGAFSLASYEPCTCTSQEPELPCRNHPSAGRRQLVEVDLEKVASQLEAVWKNPLHILRPLKGRI